MTYSGNVSNITKMKSISLAIPEKLLPSLNNLSIILSNFLAIYSHTLRCMRSVQILLRYW